MNRTWINETIEDFHANEKANPNTIGALVLPCVVAAIDLTNIENPVIKAVTVEDGDWEKALAYAWADVAGLITPDDDDWDYDEDYEDDEDDDDWYEDDEDEDDDWGDWSDDEDDDWGDDEDDDEDGTTLGETEIGDRVIIENNVYIVCSFEYGSVICRNLSKNRVETLDENTDCEIV